MTLRAPYYQHAGVTVYHGDCLDVLPQLPDNSVDLILTDPPYFKVKGDAWDNQWNTPADFLAWLDRVLVEFARILKPNGSLYLFASSQMSARVECLTATRFEVLSSIVWRKNEGTHRRADRETLREWRSQSERIVFAAPSVASTVEYLRAECAAAGLSAERLSGLLGFKESSGSIGPRRYLSIEGFAPISREHYEVLRRETGRFSADYDAVYRAFSVGTASQYTDVWDFDTVPNHPGKHVCEKPAAMLRHMISASSKPGAVVLDAFGGSGSTAQAARELGRSAISIELDESWCRKQAGRLKQGSLF